CQRRRGLAPVRQKSDAVAEPWSVRNEFLDAETGPPKSPPETTDARRDQKDPKPVAQTPAQTAYLNLTGNYPVRRDCLVADAVQRNRSLKPNSPLTGKFTGNFSNFGVLVSVPDPRKP